MSRDARSFGSGPSLMGFQGRTQIIDLEWPGELEQEKPYCAPPNQRQPNNPMSEHTPLQKIRNYLQHFDVVYLAGFLLILISLVINILDRSSQISPGRFAASLFCIGIVLILHLLRPLIASRRSKPAAVNIGMLILMGLFILGSTWLSPSITGDAYLVLIIVGMAYRLLSGPAASALTFSTVALWLLVPFYYYGAEIMLNLSLALFAGLGFIIPIGWLIRRNTMQLAHAEELTQELQQANEELRLSRLRERDVAVVEERIRLARDIHDGLGHHLTVLNVQLQAAEIQLKTEPAGAVEAIQICRQEAQHALDEVRRSVAAMRSSPLNGTSLDVALEKMIQEFARNTPLDPKFVVIGEAYPLEPSIAMTCFRAVQEGLTNVQKHALDPHQVRIDLEYNPRNVVVRVSDDGRPQTEGEAGFGKAGLQERALQLGGKFRAEALSTGGYMLELTLPSKDKHD